MTHQNEEEHDGKWDEVHPVGNAKGEGKSRGKENAKDGKQWKEPGKAWEQLGEKAQAGRTW